jgi:hypothetical protein
MVTTIHLGGPFFRKDPTKTFRGNVRVMMAAVAAEGEADVKAQLAAGEGGRLPIRRLGNRVRHHVVGRTRSIAGKQWAVTAVVSVNNSRFTKAQGISLMAAAASVESRVHAFRKTKNRIGRSRKTNMAELLKGLA